MSKVDFLSILSKLDIFNKFQMLIAICSFYSKSHEAWVATEVINPL